MAIEIGHEARAEYVADILLNNPPLSSFVELWPKRRDGHSGFKINWMELQREGPDAFRSIVYLMATEIDRWAEKQKQEGGSPLTAILGTQYGRRISLPIAEVLAVPHFREYGRNGNLDIGMDYLPPGFETGQQRGIVVVDDWVSDLWLMSSYCNSIGKTLNSDVIGLVGVVGHNIPTRPEFCYGDQSRSIQVMTTVETIRQRPNFNKLAPISSIR